LVENSLPLGVPILIAAPGETGKTTMLLELACRTAFGEKGGAAPIFGGSVVHEGSAVVLVAEESAGAIHRRLNVLDPDGARLSNKGNRLIVVPMPEEGGPRPLFVENRGMLTSTDFYKRICEQLLALRDLVLIVFDPLQTFVHARINDDPGAGQFVCSQLAALANATKAATIVSHHMRKAANGVTLASLAAARDAVRGTSALIDGVRFAYALWPADEQEAKRVCRELKTAFEPNKVVRGGVVKANEYANRKISTYVRNELGLLVDRSDYLTDSAAVQSCYLLSLTEAVSGAAQQGRPFTKTGKNGLFEQRNRLPQDLRGLSKHKLLNLADQALGQRLVVQAMAQGSRSVHWLDIPGGRFARGVGEFVHGAPN
jgi:hypothetical protein